MQWFGGKESNDVEEGSSSGGGRGFAFGGGIIGVIAVVIYLFTGVNPLALLNNGDNQNQTTQQTNMSVTGPESAEKKQARLVFEGTREVWDSLFTANGKHYQKPILHLFTGAVDAGCGFATAATGPFYCPQDRKVYLDLSFYDQLKEQFGAPGEFAQAYVIAHEVGHHVQNLLGVSQKVENAMSAAGSEAERNRYSVALELQADFYAGIWAHYENLYHQNGLVLNEGDIPSALNAAKKIGDDHLQQQAGGSVEPDSFTHGTSAQRMYWFKKGFDTGDLNQGNTFASMNLQ